MPQKILVIDDELGILKLVKTRLEAKQFEVLTAVVGEEGLEVAKRGHPDLIILDIQMPKMDGYTFVREAQKLPDLRSIPVIVLTATDKMQDLFKVEGIKDYIVKPFDGDVLLSAIKKHLPK